eukprot:gene7626-20180_t
MAVQLYAGDGHPIPAGAAWGELALPALGAPRRLCAVIYRAPREGAGRPLRPAAGSPQTGAGAKGAEAGGAEEEMQSGMQAFSANGLHPFVRQTDAGLALFWSCLYCLQRHLEYKQYRLTRPETLAELSAIPLRAFRRIVPAGAARSAGAAATPDDKVFERSADLVCEGTNERFDHPVALPPNTARASISAGIAPATGIPDNVPARRAGRPCSLAHALTLTTRDAGGGERAVTVGDCALDRRMQFLLRCYPRGDTAAEVAGFDCMRQRPPLTLRVTEPPALTFGMDGRAVVFCERPASSSRRSCQVFDPLTGMTTNVDPEEVAKELRDMREAAAMAGVIEQLSRETSEAVVVCFDVSASMSSSSFTGDEAGGLTRLDVVKQLFFAFANRTMSYDLHHVIGLVLFSSTTEVRCPLTEVFEGFRGEVDKLTATQEGTKLWDALDTAAGHLNAFVTRLEHGQKQRAGLRAGDSVRVTEAVPVAGQDGGVPAGIHGHVVGVRDGGAAEVRAVVRGHVVVFATDKVERVQQRCRKRVLCLTDGQDTNSDAKPWEMAQKLRGSGIAVDAVLVGEHNPQLWAVTRATGGHCIFPQTLTEALRAFEAETVLSLAQRAEAPRVAAVASSRALLDLAAAPGRAGDVTQPCPAPATDAEKGALREGDWVEVKDDLPFCRHGDVCCA